MLEDVRECNDSLVGEYLLEISKIVMFLSTFLDFTYLSAFASKR